jgi:hypothetical protein
MTTRSRTPDRSGGKPATNRLSYGAAEMNYLNRSERKRPDYHLPLRRMIALTRQHTITSSASRFEASYLTRHVSGHRVEKFFLLSVIGMNINVSMHPFLMITSAFPPRHLDKRIQLELPFVRT